MTAAEHDADSSVPDKDSEGVEVLSRLISREAATKQVLAAKVVELERAIEEERLEHELKLCNGKLEELENQTKLRQVKCATSPAMLCDTLSTKLNKSYAQLTTSLQLESVAVTETVDIVQSKISETIGHADSGVAMYNRERLELELEQSRLLETWKSLTVQLREHVRERESVKILSESVLKLEQGLSDKAEILRELRLRVAEDAARSFCAEQAKGRLLDAEHALMTDLDAATQEKEIVEKMTASAVREAERERLLTRFLKKHANIESRVSEDYSNSPSKIANEIRSAIEQLRSTIQQSGVSKTILTNLLNLERDLDRMEADLDKALTEENKATAALVEEVRRKRSIT